MGAMPLHDIAVLGLIVLSIASVTQRPEITTKPSTSSTETSLLFELSPNDAEK